MSDEATNALDRDIESIEPIEVFYHDRPPEKYEYKRIIRETPKAWLLEMSGGAQRWHSKKYCWLLDNIVYVPKWLDDKIWVGLWAEMEKKMDSQSCGLDNNS